MCAFAHDLQRLKRPPAWVVVAGQLLTVTVACDVTLSLAPLTVTLTSYLHLCAAPTSARHFLGHGRPTKTLSHTHTRTHTHTYKDSDLLDVRRKLIEGMYAV